MNLLASIAAVASAPLGATLLVSHIQMEPDSGSQQLARELSVAVKVSGEDRFGKMFLDSM